MKLSFNAQEVETFGVGEETTFKIASSGKMFHILISGLYSRKIESIVRETIANAYDGHVALEKRTGVKVENEIEIHAPTMWEPWYAIRDYGISMTHEFVREVYSTLGESTKDDNSDEVGAFGLGAKSPFAYTSEFSITCWLDGTKRVYTAFISETGAPKIALMSEEPSDEPRGVFVSLPVKASDTNEFLSAIRKAVIGHTAPLTCNKSLPRVTILDSMASVDWVEVDGSKRHSLLADGPFVAVGPVLYPIDFGQIDPEHMMRGRVFWESEKNAILRLPIGAVDVIPSREALSYTATTKSAMLTLMENYYEIATREIDEYLVDYKNDSWSLSLRIQEGLVALEGLRRYVLEQVVARKFPNHRDMSSAYLKDHIQLFMRDTSAPKVVRLEREAGTVVMILDSLVDNVKSLKAKAQHYLKESGLKKMYVFTKPDPLKVRNMSALLRKQGLSRDERLIKIGTYYTHAKSCRLRIDEWVEGFNCPYVVLPSDLTDPPKEPRKAGTAAEPVVLYRHKFSDSWNATTVTTLDALVPGDAKPEIICYVPLFNRKGKLIVDDHLTFEAMMRSVFKKNILIYGIASTQIVRAKKQLPCEFVELVEFIDKFFGPLASKLANTVEFYDAHNELAAKRASNTSLSYPLALDTVYEDLGNDAPPQVKAYVESFRRIEATAPTEIIDLTGDAKLIPIGRQATSLRCLRGILRHLNHSFGKPPEDDVVSTKLLSEINERYPRARTIISTWRYDRKDVVDMLRAYFRYESQRQQADLCAMFAEQTRPLDEIADDC